MVVSALLVFRHIVEDARRWGACFGRRAAAVGPDFLRDATLTTLFFAAPITVIYSSRALPTILLIAAALALTYRTAIRCSRGGPGAMRLATSAIDPRRMPWWVLSTLALIGFATLSTLWSLSPEWTFDQSVKILLILCTVLIIHRCVPPFERETHRIGAALGIALAAIILIVEFTVPGGVFRSYIYGPNPSYLNRSVVTVSLLMWPALALTTGRYRHYIRVGVIVLVIAAVAVSSSKSALLAICAGLLVTSLALISLRTAQIGVIVVGTAAFVAMPLMVKLMSDFAVETGVDEMVDLSSERRLEIWRATAEAALERPLIGWGLESSRMFGLREMPGVNWTIGPIHHPHNPILQIWVELGAIGVVLAAAIMVGVVMAVSALPARRRSFAYGAITATLAVSSVSHGAWQSWWTALLMIMIALFAIGERFPTAPRSI
ncbi:O-antigen ligase [Tepidamorphus gemmatus]|uniref:O-antigen ligase n=1 Tax=Tepidamorphus gemmatus TaxID=747076 RepID=A0A4V2UZT8_9HYPH|nr:O-antigen ligase family protein [Tepidamorphus gemmatus]TCT12623.1 O-antigen ligase [Tepidamorphus gemmatus]